MDLFCGIICLAFVLLICIFFWRRNKIIKKIHSMCTAEKCSTLDSLIAPFGFSYCPSQDIFTSRMDAWQREFGYCDLYDQTAPGFHMIFDRLPVYFDYENRTWLIEFWKGQYGINTGCEIGIYDTDRILKEKERKTALFQCVKNEDMPVLSFTLKKNDSALTSLSAKHWWLTAFLAGCFSNPSELTQQVSLTFCSSEMAAAFAQGLAESGCSRDRILVHCNTVAFTFTESDESYSRFYRFRIRLIQWQNRFWCRTYLFVTRPFCRSLDRILYLYYYLPFVFRKILRIRKYKKVHLL